jgi:SAM-dependent methyltransferase
LLPGGQTGAVEGYASSSYGDGFADVYDAWYRDVTDTGACIDRLRSLLPAGGRVLELGVGTGRLALPLADAGLAVTGVDSSPAMVAALRAKPGGHRVHVVLGDMADLGSTDPPVPDEPQFDLALAAYNTLFNLTGAGDAARGLASAARRLVPGGRLVVEAFVPRPDPDGRADSVAVSRMSVDELVLTATLHDAEAQTISGQHVQITGSGVRLRPWMVRYLHPHQLDEAATAAGLALEHRWADWAGTAFDDHCPTHVSVYRRPA